jgi:hypothetical protein
MNTLISRAGVAIATGFLCVSVVAAAEPTYEEVWTCTLEENKTIDDVQAANSKWLKWINENVKGGNISSSVVSSVVGNAKIFLYVDSYPDLTTWSAAKAALDTEEGQAVEEVFEGVSECTENHLYKMTPTE